MTSSPGGITNTGTASPVTVTGLTNGTAYTFTVKATNAVGTGPASSPSNSVTVGTPGAPTGAKATAGNARATVTFIAPTPNGTPEVSSYIVTSSPPGTISAVIGTASPITVTGLSNGTAYTFRVKARNAIGTGPASSASNSVIVGTPGAPTGVKATAGNARATVTFKVPSSNGGSPIKSYTVTSSPGGVQRSGASSPIVVTRLQNGTTYRFTVRATNAVGMGPASSASNSVRPATVPGAPTAVKATAGNTKAMVTFKAPGSDGGSPIKSYTVTSSTGNISKTGKKSPIIMTGLKNGTTYTFTVKATNAIGSGPASRKSNKVKPSKAAKADFTPEEAATIEEIQ